eukprot:gene17000-22499_t
MESGALDEADPENYGNLKYNRDRSVNVNGALCCESMLLHNSSLGVIGFVEFMTNSFFQEVSITTRQVTIAYPQSNAYL